MLNTYNIYKLQSMPSFHVDQENVFGTATGDGVERVGKGKNFII